MASRSLRVTILSQHYAPEPTGNAPYVRGLAAGLHRRGHEVRVITTFPHYPEWRVAAGYHGWSRREAVDGVDVTRLRHYVPRRPTSARRIAAETSFGARLLATGWGAPDVVVSFSPALLSTVVANSSGPLKARRSAFGVIVQDLYSLGIGETEAGGSRVAASLTRLESAVLRRADGVVVIHDRFKDRVVADLGVQSERVDVVRNWTHVPSVDDFDREAFRGQFGWAADFVVLHAGAMGDKQGLSNVVNAARIAEGLGAPLKFVLMGNGKQRSELEALASGCASIEFIDPMPDDDYVRAMRSADLLLVNQRPGVSEMAVPSKLTSYFSSGVAVLAAVDDGSTTAEEVAAAGAGIRVDAGSPEALVAAALQLREDWPRRREIGSRGPAYCERLLSEEAALEAYDAWVWKLYQRKRES